MFCKALVKIALLFLALNISVGKNKCAVYADGVFNSSLQVTTCMVSGVLKGQYFG